MRPLPEWGLGNNRDRVKGYSDLIRDHFSQSVGGEAPQEGGGDKYRRWEECKEEGSDREIGKMASFRRRKDV